MTILVPRRISLLGWKLGGSLGTEGALERCAHSDRK